MPPALELPPPQAPAPRKSNARHKDLVGLKIGASQIAAARVSNNGVAEVVQVAREGIDPGIVVGGELRDPEALADALKEFFRSNKLPKKGIRLGIANNRIGVRTFEITGIEDPKQLTNAIRFRAEEALPIPIEEAVLDYHILSETTNPEGETVRKILLVVAYRELVDRYVAACRDAGRSARRDRPRGLRAPALARGAARGRRAGRRQHWSPSRSATTAPPSPSGPARLRVHARAGLGRLDAQRRDRACTRHDAVRDGSHQARHLARARACARGRLGGGRGQGT